MTDFRDMQSRECIINAAAGNAINCKSMTDKNDFNYSVKLDNSRACETTYGEGCLYVTGYTREEFLQNPYLWITIVCDDDRPLVRDWADAIILGKKGSPLEHRIVRKDGSVRWVRNTPEIHYAADGTVSSYDGVIKDITSNRELDTLRFGCENKLSDLNKALLTVNDKLRSQALTDPHTGAYNYRYYTSMIDAEFDRARRQYAPLSVIMLDIDYFKSVNDVYGHQFGDDVLKQFVDRIKQAVRKYDIVIRYGGEEFIIVAPGSGKTEAYALAKRMERYISLSGFGDKKRSVDIKISGAVCSYPDDQVVKSQDFLNIADTILLRAKEDGGNRIYSIDDLKMKPWDDKYEEDSVAILKSKVNKLTQRGNHTVIAAMLAFARNADNKNFYTEEDIQSTVKCAVSIAEELGLPKYEIEAISKAAALRDLGKIGVPEKVLAKPGGLTRSEYGEVKKHPQISFDIIRHVHFLKNILPNVLYHHERWDGKGYPSGLKGEYIPLGARIISVADSYRALTSERPYRQAYPKNDALKIIKEASGTQFDPKIANVFVELQRSSEGHR